MPRNAEGVCKRFSLPRYALDSLVEITLPCLDGGRSYRNLYWFRFIIINEYIGGALRETDTIVRKSNNWTSHHDVYGHSGECGIYY